MKQELHPGALYPTKDGSGESHIHALYLFFGVPLFMIFNVDHLEHAGMRVPYKPLSWPQIFRISRALAERKPGAATYAAGLFAPYSYHGVKPFIELFGQDLFNRNVLLTDQDSYAEIFQTESAPAGLELLEKILPRGRTLLHKCDEHFALGEVGFLPLASSWCLNLLEMMNQEQRYFISPIPPVGKIANTGHSTQDSASEFSGTASLRTNSCWQPGSGFDSFFIAVPSICSRRISDSRSATASNPTCRRRILCFMPWRAICCAILSPAGLHRYAPGFRLYGAKDYRFSTGGNFPPEAAWTPSGRS
ncbi:MAG: hypothetical protein L6W00_01770 [Lentisphaeria bacterium]|nr:MAG: hypothetical protein L6W00_01770 [Lentisphaeria bacterium]